MNSYLKVVAVSRPVLQAVVRHVGLAKRLLGWHWDRGPCLEGWKEVAGLEEVDLNQANVHANHIHNVLGGDLSVKKGSLVEVGGEESLLEAMAKLVVVDLSNSDLSLTKLAALLEGLPTCSKVKRLSLASLPLSSLPPELFSTSFLHLEEVDLSSTDLTEEQLAAVFTPNSSANNLRRLQLCFSDLSSLFPLQLAENVATVQEVHLR